MYQVARLAAEAAAFRQAVQDAAPFRPLMVKIKLLWACNLACVMCDFSRQGAPTPLTFELLARTLDDLAALGCRKVHFSGGEPTLRADLPELIAHTRRLKMRATLTTNGTLLSKEVAKELVKARLNSVCVSIDSPCRSVHDRLRGVPGAFKQTLAGVRALRAAAERYGASLPIQINTVVSRENYATLHRLPDLAHELGAAHLLLLPVDDPSGKLLLNKRRLLDYNQRIAPALADRALTLGLMRDAHEAFPFGRTAEELGASRDGRYAQDLYEHQPCYAPWTHALIAADGRVAPCCSAPRLTMGNLQEQSFSDIWQGAVYGKLRREMRDGIPLPHCAGCDVFLAENRVLHRIYHDETDLEGTR
ncbi:MAG: radical SAM protein [Anaerolineae bacterium]|nr:radical SAM protein [Anaerolineae bacterium]